MLVSVSLAVGAFCLAIAALFYDLEARRFRFLLWDAEIGRPRPPGRPALILIGMCLAVLLFSVGNAVYISWTTDRAFAEAEHQKRRMMTHIGNPEIVLVVEVTGAELRHQVDQDPALAQKLNELLALAKMTPIPAEECLGVVIAHGVGAISDRGDLLVNVGGLSRTDFLFALGFYAADKDLAPFQKSGFELFDMFMSADFDEAQVELAYARAEDRFRLMLTDESDGFSADPLTMASGEDLVGAKAVLEAGDANSAFERGYVKRLVIRERSNREEYGIDFATLRPAAADGGWPAHSCVGDVSPPVRHCPASAATVPAGLTTSDTPLP